MRYLLALAAAACLVSPGVLLLAFPTGPGPGRTGAPGESGACTGGSCHIGSAIRGEGISIYFPNGINYRPGVLQRIQLQVTGTPAEPDFAHYGFQLSARLENQGSSEVSGGSFRAVDPATWVQCQDGRTPDPVDGRCAAGQEVQYVQHRSPARIPVWDFEWTPPAGAAGTIRFLLAGGGGTLAALSWVRLEGYFPGRPSEVLVGGQPVMNPIFAAPDQILAEIPAEAVDGQQAVKVGELETTVAFGKAAPIIAADQFTSSLYAGQPARMLVHGCGVSSETGTASVWIANHRVAASMEPVPDWPGSCTLEFTPPSAREQVHLIRACLHDSCSPGRVLVRLMTPPPD